MDFGGLFNNPILNPVGYLNNSLFSGGGGGGGGLISGLFGGSAATSAATPASNGTSQPWSLDNKNLGGRNFQTTNFGYDSSGRPNALPFESVRDNSGNLGSQYTLQGGPGITMDNTAYNKYLSEATSNGPSGWASVAMDANNNNTMNNLNKVGELGATAMSDGMSNLQMSGGMSGAQRERAATSGARDMMKNRMDVLNQGNTNELGILTQDAQNKMSMLPQAYNMSMNNAKFAQDERGYKTGIDQYNMGNKLNDVSSFNNYNNGMYSEAMKGWAALKTSEAQKAAADKQAQNSGGLFGGGGFLGTGLKF